MTRTERQLLSIERWKNAGGKATIVAATGVGKTRIGIFTIQRVLKQHPESKIVVVVPTDVLRVQWLQELEKWEGAEAEVIIINTASKAPFFCNFLIVDEIHRSASECLRQVFLNTQPQLILGLTATYERLDGKEKEVLDKYAPKCDEIPLEEARKNGWVAPYREYKVLLDVDLTEYNKMDTVFLQNFSFFGYDFETAMGCVTDFWKQQVFAKKMGCTVQEVKAHAYQWNKAMRFRKTFVMNHPKKLEIAKKILKARPHAKAITFDGSIKQCEQYDSGFVLHSGNTKKDNKQVIEEFSRCSSGVIHTSKMADEGLDLKGLNLAIITGFNSSQISKRQRIGRVIRAEEGKEAEVFTLVIKSTVEDKWFKKSSEQLRYIEIDEREREEILNNVTLNNKQEQLQNVELNFRL